MHLLMEFSKRNEGIWAITYGNLAMAFTLNNSQDWLAYSLT